MQRIRNALTLAVIGILLETWTVAANADRSIQGSDSELSLANEMTIRDRVKPSASNQYVANEYSISTDENRLALADGTYYLTMTLPDRPGKRFARLSFTEQSRGNGVSPIQFDLSSTRAFIGTPTAIGGAIAVNGAWVDETGTIWVEFKPPVSSKTTLTIAFKARQRSSRATQEYGIAAYPDTNRPVPIFVGNKVFRGE